MVELVTWNLYFSLFLAVFVVVTLFLSNEALAEDGYYDPNYYSTERYQQYQYSTPEQEAYRQQQLQQQLQQQVPATPQYNYDTKPASPSTPAPQQYPNYYY